MGALTQRQEAVTSSKDELKKHILHPTLCFITFFQRKNEPLKLSSHSNKAKSRLGKGVFLKRLVRKSTEEIEFSTGDIGVDNPLSGNNVPSELSGRVDSTEKNKRRSFGLGQLSKVYAKSKDVDALRSEIEALNKSLQKQEEEKLQMKQELDEIKEQVLSLMEHRSVGSSSHAS